MEISTIEGVPTNANVLDLLTDKQRDLVTTKNHLTPQILEKYRLAGQITHSATAYVRSLVQTAPENGLSVGQICQLGMEHLKGLVNEVFKKTEEKGIALPVRIERNDFVDGVSPEEGDEYQGGHLTDGDVIKATLGVYIDGYTAQFSETIALGVSNQAETDAMKAAHIACAATVRLISTSIMGARVNGSQIRALVDSVAKAYSVQVVPGSRVRRIRRFLAGQNNIVEESDFKGVVWMPLSDDEDTLDDLTAKIEAGIEVSPNEVWLVDIQMAATAGKNGVVVISPYSGINNEIKPTIFSRDYTVQYNLKQSSARALLGRVVDQASVYPFKLSQICTSPAALRESKLGLRENINNRILVPHTVKRAVFIASNGVERAAKRSHKNIKAASGPVTVARMMVTVVLVPSSVSASGKPEVLRLTEHYEENDEVKAYTDGNKDSEIKVRYV